MKNPVPMTCWFLVTWLSHTGFAGTDPALFTHAQNPDSVPLLPEMHYSVVLVNLKSGRRVVINEGEHIKIMVNRQDFYKGMIDRISQDSVYVDDVPVFAENITKLAYHPNPRMIAGGLLAATVEFC